MARVLATIFLLALGVGSSIVLVSAFIGTGRLLVAESPDVAVRADDVSYLVFATLSFLGFLSLFTFTLRSVPLMVNNFFSRNKDRFAAFFLGLLVCLLFIMT
jgi:hypothetical protein